jgi:hypothetical protein
LSRPIPTRDVARLALEELNCDASHARAAFEHRVAGQARRVKQTFESVVRERFGLRDVARDQAQLRGRSRDLND